MFLLPIALAGSVALAIVYFENCSRNKIEHRYVPAFDLDIFGECQAMLLNFETLLTDTFGTYYALNNTLSFPLQTSSARNHEQTKAIKKVESKHYLELKNYIDSCRDSLEPV